MSDLYGTVRSGKLKLKGEKKSKSKSKKRERDRAESDERKRRKTLELADAQRHGGWWCVTSFQQITGPVAIEMKGCFVKALDNGTFTLGPPHDQGKVWTKGLLWDYLIVQISARTSPIIPATFLYFR